MAATLTALPAFVRAQPADDPGEEAADEETPVAEAAEDEAAESPTDGAAREERPAPAANPAESPSDEVASKAVADDTAENEAAEDEAGLDVRRLATLGLGPIQVAPIMLIQAYANPYVGDDSFFQSGDIAEREGFRLRHARFGLDTRYRNDARLRVSTELASSNGGNVRVHDAFLGWTTYEFAQLFAGAQVLPVSRFALIRSGRHALVQRPYATQAMVPGHQVGLIARGRPWDGKLAYHFGLFNGLQRSNLFYEGYTRNYSPFGNRFDGLTYVARVTSEPLRPLAGTAADEDKGPFRFGVGANYFFSDGGARDVHTAGGDTHLQGAGFHLIAEVLWARTVPDAEPTVSGALPFEVTSFSAVGEVGYQVLADDLGFAARFEWIDPNTGNDDEGDNWLITGGGAYQLVDQLLKLQLEYTHREERFGQSLANDSFTISFQGQLDPARAGGDETRRDEKATPEE